MKIAILTCTTKNRKWLYDITNPTKEKYAKEYKIDFIFSNNFYEDKSMLPGWNKIAFVLKYLPFYDYIIWIDDDAGFIKFNFDIESYIKSNMKDKSFAICKDINDYNSGVFIIKNDEFGNYIFNTIWNNRNLYKKNKSKHYGFMEQPAICDMCDIFEENVYIADGKILNSYNEKLLKSPINQTNENSIILHIALGSKWKENNKELIKNLFGVKNV